MFNIGCSICRNLTVVDSVEGQAEHILAQQSHHNRARANTQVVNWLGGVNDAERLGTMAERADGKFLETRSLSGQIRE